MWDGMVRGAAFVAALALMTGLCADASFIRVRDGMFADENCTEFTFSGYNTWQLLENAASFLGSQQDVITQFQAALASNLTVVRMFGHGVATGFYLQNPAAMGTYNEQAFRAFDYVLDQAARHQLKLVISFADNWDTDSNSDNKFAYTGGKTNQDAFFTSQSARDAYKAHVRTVITRRNTINGKVYRDDDTILSWDLINEPRCDRIGCDTDMLAWIEEMAPYIKALDSNHLLTVGMDGFYDRRNCESSTGNPSGWAGYTGQDFMPQHAVRAIDYAAMHLWPDNWKRYDLDFGSGWMRNHTDDARRLGKPLVLEEFGKGVGGPNAQGQTVQQQLDWYKLIYALVEDNINSGGPLKGVMFWRWDAVNTVNLGEGDNALTIGLNSNTFQSVILPFSQRRAISQQYTNKTVVNCTPLGGAVSAASVGLPANNKASQPDFAGPGPENFTTPDAGTCCGNTCGTMYGEQTGEVVQTTATATAAECCTACKGSTQCNTWNYCYCNRGCGNNPKGTCLLKNQTNPFYPRTEIVGNDAAGWVGGVPNQANITMPWRCQPVGGCTLQNVSSCPAPVLDATLVCPDASCNATHANVGGDVLVYDVNSRQQAPGPVFTAADCCAACKSQPRCNVWTFCPRVEGCSNDCPANVQQMAQQNKPAFGPYGGCQGQRFPYRQCQLKNQTDPTAGPLRIYEAGDLQPYVSGFLASGSTA